jgi:Tripartite tricarboxylate transporter TctA family
MDVYLQALRLVLDPYVVTVIFLSAIYGLFVGCIPGLTATMATALLVPVTFFGAESDRFARARAVDRVHRAREPGRSPAFHLRRQRVAVRRQPDVLRRPV